MHIKCIKLTKKHTLLILFPIFKIFGKIIEKQLELINIFALSYYMSIGHILCILFWLSRIKLNKRKNPSSYINRTESLKTIINKDDEEEIKQQKRGLSEVEIYVKEANKKGRIKAFKELLFCIIFGICFLIATILHIFFFIKITEGKKEIVFFSLILRLILIVFLSHFTIKNTNHLLIHKIISLLFIIFITIIYVSFILLSDSFNIDEKFLFLILSEILYSLFYIGGKNYIHFTYKTPFKMIFFVGIVCFVLLSIIQIIFRYSGKSSYLWEYCIIYLKGNNKYDDEIYIDILSYFKNINIKYYLIPLFIIFILINNYFEWQIIFFFSVTHYASSNILYIAILPFLYGEFRTLKDIIFYVYYLLIVFFLLVFNEFIILFCCSLEKQTAHEKEKKREEYLSQSERNSNGSEVNDDDVNDNSNNDISNINIESEIIYSGL